MRGSEAKERLLIVGVGGHALVVADAVLASGIYELVGFVARAVSADDVLRVAPLIGGDEELVRLMGEYRIDSIVVAIGDNAIRRKVLGRLQRDHSGEVEFPAIVHPTASIGTKATIGEGSVVLAGAVVGPGAKVGDGCLVNTRASLDHHGVLEDYASLAPGVTTGGNVSIGEGSAVSIGAIVLHGRSIGDWSVVGAGATVIEDVPDGVVAYGTPAKVIRERESGAKYL
jgi:sugar O-acyltransferase (sialic acid O-acetyltransferase NeuD family)